MASNLIYEAETCPGCNNVFYPHDQRQTFCSYQCRYTYYNKQRSKENRERYSKEEQLRHSDTALEVLLNSHFYNNELIEESIILSLGIDINLCSLEKNLDTGRPIRWFHAYGLELVDKTNRLFTIHHRTK